MSTLTEQRKSYSRPDPTSKGARDNYENELLLRWRIEARQDRLIIDRAQLTVGQFQVSYLGYSVQFKREVF